MTNEEARELIMNGIMRNACIPKEKDWWNGALLKATEALEKQIPNTPLIINRNGRTIPFCPACGGLLIKCADEDYKEILDDDWIYMNYCDSCGQRIDYSEVE